MSEGLDQWKPYKHKHPDFKYSDETKQDMMLNEYWSPSGFRDVTIAGDTLIFGGQKYWIGVVDGTEVTQSVSSMVKEFTFKPVGTDLWIDLIWEEAQELFEAYDQYSHGIGKSYTDSRTELLKEMADLVYVVHGLANELGWDLDEAIQRVHQSNMSKLDDDGQPIYREDGKRIKGPNYKPPHLEDLVDG